MDGSPHQNRAIIYLEQAEFYVGLGRWMTALDLVEKICYTCSNIKFPSELVGKDVEPLARNYYKFLKENYDGAKNFSELARDLLDLSEEV